MSDRNDLALIEDAEITELQTNFGIVPQSTVEGMAVNLVEHNRGQVAGGYIPVSHQQVRQAENNPDMAKNWLYMPDQNGKETLYRPGTKKEMGDLHPDDAVRVVQKTLSRGLNPMAHISLWYQGGKLIDHVNYTIVKGMAEQQKQSSFEFADMDPDERKRNNLLPADIGKVAYLILDSDKPLYLQATVQFGAELGFAEAKRQALEMIQKGRGIGIVRKDEGLYTPKGRSLSWIAEKRAMTDATRRAFGEMTLAQIAHYSSGQGLLKKQDVNTLASPEYQRIAQLPADIQQRYLEMDRQVQEIKETPVEELQAASKASVAIMRNNGDDDPLGEEGSKPHPAMDPSTKFWKYAYSKGFDNNSAGEYIRQADGDFDQALKALKSSEEVK